MSAEAPYWRTTALEDMSEAQWEALCDGCGKCCLNKLEDWDTGEFYFTNVACKLFDDGSCRCSDYANRFDTVADCIKLTPGTVRSYRWLPSTCAYRLVADGRDLPAWHHLVCGDREAVHDGHRSVQGRTVSEREVPEEEYEFHLIDWIEGGPFREIVMK